MAKTNLFEEKALDMFAEMMIERISSIQQNWKKPWFTPGTSMWAHNLSGREYNGMNALMLAMHCEDKGYEYPIFGTFDAYKRLSKDNKGNAIKNAEGKEIDVCVKKGEKSFPVFITTFTVVDDQKNKIPYDKYKSLGKEEREKYRVYPRMMVYSVFNIAQTNLKEAMPELYSKLCPSVDNMKHDDDFSFAPIDRMIDEDSWHCKISPTYGDDAYYSISKDCICIPEKRQFKDGESFYSNLMHEMAHSTGAESRLNRLKPSSFGSKEYAREELVAELSAALCANRFGMTKNLKEDSAAYLKNWLDSLKEDTKFIKTVLLDVKRASKMINDKVIEMSA